MKAWLERTDGRTFEIATDCAIGRTADNAIRIESGGVSRRHALLRVQQAGGVTEFWIADLGSLNGTIHNGKRVTIPCRLKNGDVIGVGDERLVFRLEAGADAAALPEERMPATVPIRRSRACWLLMVDIKSYTALSQRVDEETLGRMVGAWLRQCRDAIESTGGVIDKLLGDAIFAYWPAETTGVGQVTTTLRELVQLQQARNPDFRIVLHRGPVVLEGEAGGANNVSGLEVIFVFRMEKTCAGIGEDTLVSAPAHAALAGALPCAALGVYPLSGFAGTHAMFRLSG